PARRALNARQKARHPPDGLVVPAGQEAGGGGQRRRERERKAGEKRDCGEHTECSEKASAVTAKPRSEPREPGKAEERKGHDTCCHESDRMAAERFRHVRALETLAQAAEHREDEPESERGARAVEERRDQAAACRRVQQRDAEHGAVARDQRDVEPEDAMQHRRQPPDQELSELNRRADHENEANQAQILELEGNQQEPVDEIAEARSGRQHETGRERHADGAFEPARRAHERAEAEELHEHEVVDERSRDDDQEQLHVAFLTPESFVRGTRSTRASPTDRLQPVTLAAQVAPRGAQLTFIPGSAPSSGCSRKTPGPSPLAASTIPSDVPKRILRGFRFATSTTSRPSRADGSYALRMPANTVRVAPPVSSVSFSSLSAPSTCSACTTRATRRSMREKSSMSISAVSAAVSVSAGCVIVLSLLRAATAERVSSTMASTAAGSTRCSSGRNLSIGRSSRASPASDQAKGSIARNFSARAASSGSTGFRYSTRIRKRFSPCVQT